MFLLCLVIYAGLEGTESSTANFAPTFVFIIFWLLPLPLSVLFGDVFRAFNPWRAIGRATAWVAKTASRSELPAPLEYPRRLGRWPAVVGILAFVWLEIASAGGRRSDRTSRSQHASAQRISKDDFPAPQGRSLQEIAKGVRRVTAGSRPRSTSR